MVKMFGAHLVVESWKKVLSDSFFFLGGTNSRRDGSLWQCVFNWSWGHASGGFQTWYIVLFFLYCTWSLLSRLGLMPCSLKQIRKTVPSQQWWSEAPLITWWMTLRGLWMMGSTPTSFWSGYVNAEKLSNEYTLQLNNFTSSSTVLSVVHADSQGQAAGTWSRCHRDRTGQAAYFLRRGR